MPAEWEYVGLDIKEGPNVDVVGDAHDLVDAVGRDGFDAVFSIATFEHLAMPWKAVLAVNQVLISKAWSIWARAPGLHEHPVDFWRFSDQAWRALFNKATGFEIVEVAMGEPANGADHGQERPPRRPPARLPHLSVLARKIGPATRRVERPDRPGRDRDLSPLNPQGLLPLPAHRAPVVGSVMPRYQVTLKDRTVEWIDDADAYQQEGQMTTFFALGDERRVVDCWSTRLASFRTSEILIIRRRGDQGTYAPSQAIDEARHHPAPMAASAARSTCGGRISTARVNSSGNALIP